MSASSQSYPDTDLPASPLTITEVEFEPSPVLGTSKVYLCATVGAALGVLLGVGIAASLAVPQKLAHLHRGTDPAAPAPDRGLTASAAAATAPTPPPGPRDFGSLDAPAEGLKGHLTADWSGTASYRLVVEPGDPVEQPGFALSVAGSSRPLSVGFQLKDAKGAVLCSQDVIVRFDPERADGSRADSAALGQLEAQETAREQGHDVFENEIGDTGAIDAIDAEGKLPCSREAYSGATTWAFAPDFPTVAEQAKLIKENEPAAPAVAHAAHSRSRKHAHGRRLSEAGNGASAAKAAGQ